MFKGRSVCVCVGGGGGEACSSKNTLKMKVELRTALGI
jgi:hypothetical protein